MDELTSRQKKLLWAVVKEYVDTAQPVGSQGLCQKYLDIECSSATIRNELAELEKNGYLTHPYTSAGRIPTDKGYRFYVDELMEAYRLTNREKNLIDLLQSAMSRDINSIMEETVKTLQSISGNYASIVKTNDDLFADLTKTVRNGVEKTNKESLYLSGLSRMFYEPEFENVQNIRKMMSMLDQKEKFLELLDEYSDPNNVSVHIGSELNEEDLSECSLVTKEFHYRGETLGSIAIIGPTRMKYSKITTTINNIAQMLDDFFETV